MAARVSLPVLTTNRDSTIPVTLRALDAAAAPEPKIVHGSVRTGQQVYAQKRSLVVLGAVHSGAEVLSDGSIFVMGKLGGRALAGIGGDPTAKVGAHPSVLISRFSPIDSRPSSCPSATASPPGKTPSSRTNPPMPRWSTAKSRIIPNRLCWRVDLFPQGRFAVLVQRLREQRGLFVHNPGRALVLDALVSNVEPQGRRIGECE